MVRFSYFFFFSRILSFSLRKERSIASSLRKRSLLKNARRRRALSQEKKERNLKNSRGNDVAKTISVRHQSRFIHRAFATIVSGVDDCDHSGFVFREQKFAPSSLLRGTGKQ